MSLIEIARQNRLKALASLETQNIFADLASGPLSKSRRFLERPARPAKRVKHPIFSSLKAAGSDVAAFVISGGIFSPFAALLETYVGVVTSRGV